MSNPDPHRRQGADVEPPAPSRVAPPGAARWIEWLDWFAPGCRDPEVLRQRRIAAAVCLVGAVGTGIGVGLSQWPPPSVAVRVASVGLAGILLLVPLSMRARAHFGVLRHVPPAAVATWVVLVLVVTEGRDLTGFFVAVAMPALAVFTCGPRAAALWCIALCAVLLSIGLEARGEGWVALAPDAARDPLWAYLGTVICNLVVLGALLAFEQLRTRSLEELAEARRRERRAERLRLEDVRRFNQRLEALVQQRTLELERSQLQLRRGERLASLGTLAAGLAHELNNPLQVVRSAVEYARACRDDTDAAEVTEQALKDIEAHAERCARIVRRVLRFSGEAGGDAQHIRVRDLLESVLETCRPFSEERGARVDVEIPGEDEELFVHPLEIEQALAEVVRNAVESRPRGAIVTVRVDGDEAWVRIHVRDDGEGILPDELPHVCDPFFTTRKHEGRRGLGLAAAHGIAHAHGGRLLVASRPGQGTRVSLELPRRGVAAAEGVG